jgi:hypothetical protein
MEVYKLIKSDLKDAETLLSDSYLKGDNTSYPIASAERVRPNKWAASALLAKVYLYLNSWANAEVEATSVINNTLMYDTVSLNNVFLKNNKEAIWQLMPVLSGYNTIEGNLLILTAAPSGTYAAALSNQLINAFDTNDNRKSNWVCKRPFFSVSSKVELLD